AGQVSVRLGTRPVGFIRQAGIGELPVDRISPGQREAHTGVADKLRAVGTVDLNALRAYLRHIAGEADVGRGRFLAVGDVQLGLVLVHHAYRLLIILDVAQVVVRVEHQGAVEQY